MKLLQKINRNYIGYSMLVILLVGGGLTLILKTITQNEIDEQLVSELKSVEQRIRRNPEKACFDPMVNITRLSIPSVSVPIFSDTMLSEPPENDAEGFRMVTACDTVGGVGYKIRISTSMIPTSEFLGLLLMTVLGAMILLVTGLIILNRRLARETWKPFRQYLDQLQSFSFDNHTQIQLAPSEIEEFSELRLVIERFTEKALKDFTNLKEFTENASHEIQTPLAIIQARLDALIGSGTMDEEQGNQVEIIQQAIRRLTRLNQALIMLTRIENRQFSDSQPIDLGQLTRLQIEQTADLFKARGLNLITDLPQGVVINSNPYLLEIIIGNLLSNCIKHASPDSDIKILLNQQSISFTNAGETVNKDPETFFDRFVKGSKSSGSLGLGLTLVKKICIVAGWNVNYQFADGIHRVTVSFNGIPKES